MVAKNHQAFYNQIILEREVHRIMKKTLSILLAISMLFTLMIPAFAAQDTEDDILPVISVRGFGSTLYVENEDGTEKNVFSYSPTQISSMAADLTGALAALAMKNDYEGFVDKLRETVAIIAADLLMDDEGNSVKPVVTHSDPTDVDSHLNTEYAYFHRDESHGNYVFEYDWRMSPLDIADELNDYIQAVKETTGKDKVALLSHSEGNNVTMSYFYKYGTDDIAKTIHLSAAYQGISIIGEAFTKRVDLATKGGGLESFLTTVLGNDSLFGLLNTVIGNLNRMGILDLVLNGMDRVLNKTLDQVYDEILIETFATMPAMWSFVPDEYYDEAKQTMFSGDPKYDTLVSAIDDYHDNVQMHVSDLIQSAMDNGVAVSIVCGYGISVIPVTTVTDSQGDMLIDTKYASLGATAAPFGETLASGERLSPDNQIDASTCAFPDFTWFVKYQSHNNFCEPYKAFILWLLQYPGQPTVNSSEEYPQFLICVNHEYLRPVEADDERKTPDLLQLIMQYFKMLIEKLTGVFSTMKISR
jgi:hypothetical protein